MSEMCLLYGWTLDFCLKMPARTFFAMLKAGRKLDAQKKYSFMADLSDVSAVPLYLPEYHSKLRDYYLSLAYPINKSKNENVFDGKDPNAFAFFSAMIGR